MIRLLRINLILVFIFLIASCSAESDKSDTDPRKTLWQNTLEASQEPKEVDENACKYVKSDQTRENTFPFNACDKIEVIAHDEVVRDYHEDSIIVDGKYMVKEIQQRITLNDNQIDSLFSILYDYVPQTENPAMTAVDCYNPHHTFLFSKGTKAISYLEICIECYNYRTNNANFGRFCTETWCKLFEFLKGVGVTYGFMVTELECQWYSKDR